MKHHYTLIVFCILSFSLSALSQVAFIVPDTRVMKENIIGAEIRIKTRDSISGLQFTLEWNPDILQFIKADSVKLPDASLDIFGLSSVNNGKMRFIWIVNSSEGLLFKDSFTIFKIFFKGVGSKGASSPVKFTNSLTRIKAFIQRNQSVDSIPTTTRDGLITIEGTSAVENGQYTDGTSRQSREGGVKLYPNVPNPVSTQTLIPFELHEAEDIKFQIYDSIGRLVVEKKGFYPAGKHELRLDTEGVLQKGIYKYGIRTKRCFISRTLMKM